MDNSLRYGVHVWDRSVEKTCSVAEISSFEQRIHQHVLPLDKLMERAGCACVEVICSHVDKAYYASREALVLAGSGNNGGDAWIVARELDKRGWHVRLVCKSPLRVTAWPAHEVIQEVLTCQHQGSGTIEIIEDPSSEDLRDYLDQACVIVDGILGTGFSHDQVREPYATWLRVVIEWVETRQCIPLKEEQPLLCAIDVPSGFHADSATCAEMVFPADLTVTMLAPKQGFVAQLDSLLEGCSAPVYGTVWVASLLTPEECSTLKEYER